MADLIVFGIMAGVVVVTRSWRWAVWMMLFVGLAVLLNYSPRHSTEAYWLAGVAWLWMFTTAAAMFIGIIRWLIARPSHRSRSARA